MILKIGFLDKPRFWQHIFNTGGLKIIRKEVKMKKIGILM